MQQAASSPSIQNNLVYNSVPVTSAHCVSSYSSHVRMVLQVIPERHGRPDFATIFLLSFDSQSLSSSRGTASFFDEFDGFSSFVFVQPATLPYFYVEHFDAHASAASADVMFRRDAPEQRDIARDLPGTAAPSFTLTPFTQRRLRRRLPNTSEYRRRFC